MEPKHVRVEGEDDKETEKSVATEDDVESQNQGSHDNDEISVIVEDPQARPPFIPPGIAVIKTRRQKCDVRTRQAQYIEELMKRSIIRASGPLPRLFATEVLH